MTALILPKSHPQRFLINDEVHARPTEAMQAPLRCSYLVFTMDKDVAANPWGPVTDLAGRFGKAGPEEDSNHFRADLGPLRLKWEKHTEFVRYTFIAEGADPEDPFGETAIEEVPADWIANHPGDTIVAAHATLLEGGLTDAAAEVARKVFGTEQAVGSAVAGGTGVALTDFFIKDDGFSRLLAMNGSMSPTQAGRTIQRLLEIDTYRIMALLALPVARGLTPFLAQCESELGGVMEAMSEGGDTDEPELLNRLTNLEADIESRYTNNHSRFSAANAYYSLVRQRIGELREERIEGLQTFGEFTERRLAPAMNTCVAIAQRQEALSERVSRASQLLSTRVDISRSQQNQRLLESMNRRAKLQLRLQQTVEGLSIAAITYYIVGLVGYAAKGISDLGVEIHPGVVTAVSIPVVAIVVGFGVRRVRQIVTTTDQRDTKTGS